MKFLGKIDKKEREWLIINKHESKYFNTAILMDQSLINLLEKKDIDYITVKEICETAFVNRSTFYLHYESISDLLLEAMDYVNKKFIECFDEDTSQFIKKIDNSSLNDLNLIKNKYLTPYLNFIKNNKKIFQASFNNPSGMQVFDRYNDLNKYILIPILERYSIPEKEIKYWINFYIYGIMAIIEEWIKNDCIEDINLIESIIIKCVGVDEI